MSSTHERHKSALNGYSYASGWRRRSSFKYYYIIPLHDEVGMRNYKNTDKSSLSANEALSYEKFVCILHEVKVIRNILSEKKNHCVLR